MQFKPGTRVLFFSAHPDDETMIAGTMFLLRQQKCDIHVAWMTSAFSPRGFQVREAEARAAMSAIQLPEENLHFCRLPCWTIGYFDFSLSKIKDLFETVKPDVCVFPALEGGHIDHDSAHVLAVLAARHLKEKITKEVLLFEYPLYNSGGTMWTWYTRIGGFPDGYAREIFQNPLDDPAIDFKLDMMKTYKSQWMFMFPAILLNPRSKLKKVGEPYAPVPLDRDLTTRPHPGKLAYERFFNFWMGVTFETFQAYLSNYLKNSR